MHQGPGDVKQELGERNWLQPAAGWGGPGVGANSFQEVKQEAVTGQKAPNHAHEP